MKGDIKKEKELKEEEIVEIDGLYESAQAEEKMLEG